MHKVAEVDPAQTERKKTVCTTLTYVVRSSALRDQIDPKSFFMMLSSNFVTLVRGETLELQPIWEALSAQHAPEALFGLFLKFEEAVEKIGLTANLPPAVAALSA